MTLTLKNIEILDVVSFMNLVSSENEPEKIKFQRIQKNSSTIPVAWRDAAHCGMILGQGRVAGSATGARRRDTSLGSSSWSPKV